MKNIGFVFSFILSETLASFFGLKSEYHLILVPKKILKKLGIDQTNPKFELILDKKHLSLRLTLPTGMTDKDLRVLQDE